MQSMKIKIGDRELPPRIQTTLPSSPAPAAARGEAAKDREPQQRPEADKAWSLRRTSH